MKKKIIILSPAHPLRGGIASSSERLAHEFQQENHDVKIISFSLQYPNFLFPGKTQYTDDPAPENLSIETRLNSVNPINWLRTGWYLRQQQADLIIVRYWLPFMGPSLGTVCRIARSNTHTKVIALADNIIPHETRIGDKQFTQYFCHSVDAFLVMSKSVGEDAKRFAPLKKVVYAPHPIYDNYGPIIDRNQALKHLNLDSNTRYILFFGFIRDYKGLDILLNAMADKSVKNIDFKLIIAGEYYGSNEKYLKIIKDNHLQEKVILRTNFISNEEVKYYFGASDLIAQPYRTATQSGISQLAYHFEKPMLVTNVGGLPEIVEHGKVGYVVDVNEKAVANAIHDFFTHSRLEKMARRVRENKKLFSWDKMVQAFWKLFESIK